MQLRDWQKKGMDKIVHIIQKDDGSSVVTVDACVGSGKTAVMLETINSYIKQFPNQKTLSFFVAPRISLCQQQLESFIDDYTDFINDNKVEVIEWNCKSTEHINTLRGRIDLLTEMPLDRKSVLDNVEPKHFVIFIVCESMFGSTQTKKSRYETDINPFLSEVVSRGIIPCYIGLDEAHNYANYQKYIFGKQYALEAE